MASGRPNGWILVALATLGSVGGGVLIGRSASAEMDPFYANLSVRMPVDPSEDDSVQVVDSDGDSRWIRTDAFDYSRAVVGETDESRY
jgi:hypothetical protein